MRKNEALKDPKQEQREISLFITFLLMHCFPIHFSL